MGGKTGPTITIIRIHMSHGVYNWYGLAVNGSTTIDHASSNLLGQYVNAHAQQPQLLQYTYYYNVDYCNKHNDINDYNNNNCNFYHDANYYDYHHNARNYNFCHNNYGQYNHNADYYKHNIDCYNNFIN
uniref:Uncharacterized protein n=1 Tax=Plectus sambesii TaxID=2011161 RepID=A0A914V3X5_9BILA